MNERNGSSLSALLGLKVMLALLALFVGVRTVGSFLSPTGVKKSSQETMSLTVTAYRPIAKQTDSSPNWTSVGTPAVMGVCAVSRDLLNSGALLYGDLVEVSNLGVYKVFDTMNIRHKQHIDILVYTVTQERIVGWRRNVTVRKIKRSLPDD